MMKYKGYIATIEYDDSVDLFHGEVVNAAPYPIATFMASDVEGLKREFRISIEEYFAVCEEYKLEPQPPNSRELNLILDAELYRRVVNAAANDEMSVDGWIRDVIRREAKKCESDAVMSFAGASCQAE